MFENPQCATCLFKSSAVKTLDVTQIGQLEQNCAIASLKKGDIIFKQGVFSSNIVFLKKGIVKLFVEDDYNEQILKIVKGPTYLGIPTTLDVKFNHYSAKALDDVNACFVEINTFKSFVHNNGKFAYEIIVELCKNEINLFNKYISRSQKNARGRIADAILFLYEEIFNDKTFVMPLTRQELSDYVDTSRESVSRILTEFTNDKIIELKGRKINIIDFDKLKLVSQTG